MANQLLYHVQLRTKNANFGTAALDLRDPADQLSAGNQSVVSARAIPTSENMSIAFTGGTGHHAMDNQAAFS